MKFKVEFRKTCKVCDKPITGKRFRTYCGEQCRNKFNNKKNAWRGVIWQRAQRDRIASKPDKNKVQCLVCGKYYVQVGTHIVQVHGMTGREYREAYDLEVKRGIVPAWYRELKGDQALENGTVDNLKAGERFRFVPGDKKAGKYKRSPVTIARIREMQKKYLKKKR